jgi:hypothetical protein
LDLAGVHPLDRLEGLDHCQPGSNIAFPKRTSDDPAAAILSGSAVARHCGWPHRIPAGIGDHDLAEQVAEEIGWTGFVFARFQDRQGPLRAALLTTLFFWLFHIPSFYVDTRSWATTALVLGIFLLPHLGSRLITGWLYNGAGASVLIAGLFHSMHNATVNPTGLVAVASLPQFEVLVIMAGIVVLAAALIAVATRGHLGSSDPNQMPI